MKTRSWARGCRAALTLASTMILMSCGGKAVQDGGTLVDLCRDICEVWEKDCDTPCGGGWDCETYITSADECRPAAEAAIRCHHQHLDKLAAECSFGDECRTEAEALNACDAAQ
jgi:hypothetical protein